MAEAVYLLCAVTSLLCAGMLVRSYRRSRMKLILWTSLCFMGLAVNNVLLFVDLAIIPKDVDLRILRNLTAVGALAILLYGMITSEGR
jgi:hypothetical protein